MALTMWEVPDPGRGEQARPWQAEDSVGAQRWGMQSRGPCPGQAEWKERERVMKELDKRARAEPAQKFQEVRGQTGLD